MLQALLLDLDDTLLGNSMTVFVPAYFQALTRFARHEVDPDRLIEELIRATTSMEANDGTGASNEEVFAAAFYPAVGRERADLQPLFERFYEEAFPALRRLTRPRPEARPLVEWAFAAGLQVVIATNPLFPLSAIEQRLDWAGVPASDFPFALVTSYEVMHATKARPAYYREIVAHLGVPAGACLMAGDTWEWDIVNSTEAGLGAFWVTTSPPAVPDPVVPLAGAGDLGDLWSHLRADVEARAGERHPG